MVAFVILFNFILLPQNEVYAFAATLAAIGVTYKIAEAIYLFVLASAAVGVTYATWEEAKKVYDMYEGTSPSPLDYPDWQPKVEQIKESKRFLTNEEWFAKFGLQVIPGGLPPGDPDPQGNKRGILAFMGAIGVMGGFVNNFLALFKPLALEPGESILYDDTYTNAVNGIGITHIPSIFTPKSGHIIYDKCFNFDEYFVELPFVNRRTGGWHTIYLDNSVAMAKINGIEVSSNYVGDSFDSYTSANPQMWGIIVTIDESNNHVIVKEQRTGLIKYRLVIPGENIPKPILPERATIYDFNVSENSPLLDPTIEPIMPQPNLIPIRRLKPSVSPDGSTVLDYPGSVDELLNDIVMNTPIEEVLNPEPYPYTITPRPDGTVRILPLTDPTTPYPQYPIQPKPEIWPPLYPDPNTWPSEVPYPTRPNPAQWPPIKPNNWPPGVPYPYPVTEPWPPVVPLPLPLPDTWPPTVPNPYPDPNTWPETVPYPYPLPQPVSPPSPQTPVEPGKQIDYTPWLQIIINWLSKIWNKIPIIPDVPVDEDVPDLIFPEPEYLKDKISEIQPIINDKLQIPSTAPLTGLFDFGCTPIPDQYFGSHKIIDMSKVNDLAPTFAGYQRIFWWVIIILMGMNNAYKLIRGTNLIGLKGREK